MQSFIMPLAGGLLIGCSAVILLLALGRIAGISGIIWGAVSGEPDAAWRWLFILGLLLGPLLYHAASGLPYPAPVSRSWWAAPIGGLLVGIGVKLGSGCTSGHGICGIGRLSMRSFSATLTFMATGIATVYLMSHLTGGP